MINLTLHSTKSDSINLSAYSIRLATYEADLNGLAHKVSFSTVNATSILMRPVRPLTLQRLREVSVRQLPAFYIQTVVYVSCDVHAEAKNVG